MRYIFARQMLQSTSSASTLVVFPGYSLLQDDVFNWLQPAIVAINQYACCQNTYFVEKKWKDEMDTCILCHEEIPKMYKIPRGTCKNAQHYMRNLQKCKTSHEEIPNMHKIPRESSENAQNLMINLE